MEGTWIKLKSGEWGVRIAGNVTPTQDAIVTITRNDGESSVEMVDSVVWKGEGVTLCTLQDRQTDKFECPTCDFTFEPWGKPCVCGDHKCPNGHCSCDKGPPTKLCKGCFLQKHVALFDEGSDHCNDTCS